jgi:hypothetical protein
LGANQAKPFPLSALLSQALVAFIVEFDNEFEHQVPHRTTNHGSTQHGSTPDSQNPPWLVSMVMWSRFMRFVPQDGIAIDELQRQLGVTRKSMLAWLTRLGKWWGYLSVERTNGAVRPTAAGLVAQGVWRSLEATIETRWEERFGKTTINQLRECLRAVSGQLSVELPDSLPILGYGLFTKGQDLGHINGSDPALAAPLSRILLAFALEFEGESEVSLAICANVLRLVDTNPVRVRDLPSLSGVSKEAIATSLSFLQKRGYAAVRTESPNRIKTLTLSAKGTHARNLYRQLPWDIEERWRTRFGDETVRGLRKSLELIALELFRGLEPYPDGWRAAVARPEGLPHYPMILHRGGFPDGS